MTSQVLQLYKAYASDRNIFYTCLVHRLPGVSAPYLPWPWRFYFSYYLFILNSDNTKVTVKKLEKLKNKWYFSMFCQMWMHLTSKYQRIKVFGTWEFVRNRGAPDRNSIRQNLETPRPPWTTPVVVAASASWQAIREFSWFGWNWCCIMVKSRFSVIKKVDLEDLKGLKI